MSPGSSDYRSNEFDYDNNNAAYRRDSSTDDSHGVPRPTNMPARNRKMKGREKSPASQVGMQRRRNKHWNW